LLYLLIVYIVVFLNLNFSYTVISVALHYLITNNIFVFLSKFFRNSRLLPIIIAVLIVVIVAIHLYLIVAYLNIVLLLAGVVEGIKLLLLLLLLRLHLLLLSHLFVISLEVYLLLLLCFYFVHNINVLLLDVNVVLCSTHFSY